MTSSPLPCFRTVIFSPVMAGVIGQPASPPHLYAGGTRVYVLEAALGDDSGSADYNLGDDGLVVTDAQQRVVP